MPLYHLEPTELARERLPALLGECVYQHEGVQFATGRQLGSQLLQALCRGDQHARLTVAQDIADLSRLEHRIDRDEAAARRRRGKNTDHGLRLLGEIDGDTFRGTQLLCQQAVSRVAHLLCDLRVGQHRIAKQQRGP